MKTQTQTTIKENSKYIFLYFFTTCLISSVTIIKIMQFNNITIF